MLLWLMWTCYTSAEIRHSSSSFHEDFSPKDLIGKCQREGKEASWKINVLKRLVLAELRSSCFS